MVSPAWAAPSLTVDLLRSGGVPVLDSDSNWQWVVSVTPDGNLFADNPPNGVGGSVATELGFTASGGSDLVSVAKNATNFPNDDPGAAIAGFPAGPGAMMSGNNAVAFLGSTYFPVVGLVTDPQPAQELVIIKTVGPFGNLVGGLTDTTLAWSGAYTGMGRIAQKGTNFDTFAGSVTKTVLGGDANMDGDTNFDDFSILQNNYVPPGSYIWSQGDFNRDHEVDFDDFSILQNDYVTAAIPAPGGGSGGLAANGVPEPASVALVFLAACVVSVFRGRNRK
jgi:hypothetical protein